KITDWLNNMGCSVICIVNVTIDRKILFEIWYVIITYRQSSNTIAKTNPTAPPKETTSTTYLQMQPKSPMRSAKKIGDENS
ncbi:MAG: hypothetical protein M1368_00620, partial [Thaumarchaeota archaeon]|nr:hypothetical protein [Nitrososphaerota archaeon]